MYDNVLHFFCEIQVKGWNLLSKPADKSCRPMASNDSIELLIRYF